MTKNKEGPFNKTLEGIVETNGSSESKFKQFVSQYRREIIIFGSGLAVAGIAGLGWLGISNAIESYQNRPQEIIVAELPSTETQEYLPPTKTIVPTEIPPAETEIPPTETIEDELPGEIFFKISDISGFSILNPNTLEVEGSLLNERNPYHFEFLSNGDIIFNTAFEYNQFTLRYYNRETGEETQLAYCANNFEVSPDNYKILYLCTTEQKNSSSYVSYSTSLYVLNLETMEKEKRAEQVEDAKWLNNEDIIFTNSIRGFLKADNGITYMVHPFNKTNAEGAFQIDYLRSGVNYFYPTIDNKILAMVVTDGEFGLLSLDLYGDETHYISDAWSSDVENYWQYFEREGLSPDNKLVAMSYLDEKNGLYTVNIESGEMKTLVENLLIYDFSWSPDSKWIVFTAWNEDNESTDLYYIKPDGTGLKQLTYTPDIHEKSPNWQP